MLVIFLVLFFIFFIFPFLSMYLERDLGISFEDDNIYILIGTVIILLIIYYIMKNIFIKINKKKKNEITPKQREKFYDLIDQYMFDSVNY